MKERSKRVDESKKGDSACELAPKKYLILSVSCGGISLVTKEPHTPHLESFIKPQKVKEASALKQTLNRVKFNGTCQK